MYSSNAPPSSSPSTTISTIDAAPLLTHSVADHLLRSRRILRRTPPHLRSAARLLRRASGRRMMLREPSVRVRENAAEQLEERQNDWAYSKPVVVLDILWNLAFLGVAASVLVLSEKENPSVPLRFWIGGYALQCVIHLVCVCAEYRWRCRGARLEQNYSGLGSNSALGSGFSDSDGGESEDYGAEQSRDEEGNSVAKHLESANTMFSFIWWIIGFYWVTSGGQNLTLDSPQLYWLCVSFLAFDVIFVVICVVVACLIGIAVCCCLPCIIAILYAVADQEGATKEEIDQLPKYKFHRIGDFEKANGEIQESFGGIMTECDSNTPIEHVLPQDDAECCICLSAYEDGTELRELPCRHHFHCTCIDRWLHINATCPLCKFNILKAGDQSSSEEV